MTSQIIPDLPGLARYTVTVRAVCKEGQFGVAGPRLAFETPSRPPSSSPVIVENVTCYRQDLAACNQTLIRWNGIGNDQWNGIMKYYVVQVADITPDSSVQLEQDVSPDQRQLLIENLEVYMYTV